MVSLVESVGGISTETPVSRKISLIVVRPFPMIYLCWDFLTSTETVTYFFYVAYKSTFKLETFFEIFNIPKVPGPQNAYHNLMFFLKRLNNSSDPILFTNYVEFVTINSDRWNINSDTVFRAQLVDFLVERTTDEGVKPLRNGKSFRSLL